MWAPIKKKTTRRQSSLYADKTTSAAVPLLPVSCEFRATTPVAALRTSCRNYTAFLSNSQGKLLRTAILKFGGYQHE